ncbi:xylose isomerase [Prosthecobacter vanneervenii]|uniref:Xylose isomerase n=1 Tax=Prosthecobacter vanneervenii TaxID=48466 RepID=A0A7W7YA62_9BACT|nr:xylose isomerase [Prosthecobacter vanneervenii]MBB5032456.1 xylose isomerase [Prosthecobacter vanneervenii]
MNEAFPDIPKIQYEGPKSRNPLSFKHYNPDEVVGGKSMRSQLRFAVAYWHAMRNSLSDPFGGGTAQRPWDDGSNSVANAQRRVWACFEFMEKLGVDYYCWHDRDVAPELNTLAESNAAFDAVADELEKAQKQTGKKLLWGTACLFSHARYCQGAATSPHAGVFAYAAAQVKKAMDVTHRLGGEGYTFWGGREGYATLWNTNMKRELDHLARLLHMAVDYKKKIGFTGQFYIEPKPREPSTHQYDSDSAACLNFLREYGLLEHFKLNLETNHATLAGHTMRHEMQVAIAANALGSVDANTGDELIGWDTDQFPTNIYLTTEIMLEVLRMGGFTTGGLNFDAKCRRESFEPVDLFHAHIGGMDAFARGLKVAHAMIEDGRIDAFIKQRYSTFDSGIGAKIEKGEVGFAELEAYALANGEPLLGSGRQEMLENLVNDYL